MSEKGSVVVGIVAIVALCSLVGSCVHDYAKSSPMALDVLVTDKDYRPAHSDTHCSTDSKGYMSCSTTYYPPSWQIEYADEQRHWTSVSQGTYDQLHIGDKKVVQFDLGGGFWKSRYNERFVLVPQVAEGSWPAR